MTVQKMNYRASVESLQPIMPSQIPDVQIDYHGLVKYAKEVGKSVADLSDKEKDAYIIGSTMSELRKSAIYNYYG